MTGEREPERRFLGVVDVDSGTLLIGDPAYFLPRAADEKPGIDYQAVIDAPLVLAQRLAKEPVLLLSQFGGDGTFPVFAEFHDDGEIARVTIEFVDPEDLAEDDGA